MKRGSEERRLYQLQWAKDHPESGRAGSQRWREKNLERAREINRAHYRANKQPYLARAALMRAHGKQAAPAWLTKEQWQEIAAFYELAQQTTIATGVLHVVDHFWPLKGENSCGLHVPWNLQVITHARNVAKGSKEPEG
jgi:hypothetical protein